jgi:Sap, sulfolipid-1-addressing protein
VSFLTILPMAIVMIAGPQILTAIFLATSEHWPRNTAAYLAGATLSITLIVSLAYLLSSGATREGPSDTLYVIVLVLLVAAAVHVFLARKTAEPPKWMGKLQTASPRFSFRLGFLLLGVFPTDILTSIAVGTCPASRI